ncbi:FAD-binding protein [Salinibacterium soli]|uniref:FAD-binding protein n=1 Tax=Antiquaquibacter soli TaxID=3064523 RepID=A0ABT9BMI6_9MICO|nr:FAD-binding protein [Protaetiibacter sp. WY-16]MDO7882241.1 FAD-binding protein [Protaetiibacter sp. WY-16]
MTVGFNWSGHHEFRARTVHRPRSLEELQEVVARAPRIRALGSRHSFSDIADSAELVSLEAMPAAIRIDGESETVSLSGGVRYGDLGPVLQSAGWALRNLASLPHISVAGSIATGTHGSGDRNGTLSRAVSSIEYVLADGSLRTISPVDDDFDGAVVALGALGVVHRITLDVEPTFDVRQDVYEGLTWSSLLDNLEGVFSRAYSVSVFTNWSGDDVGRVWLKSVIGERRPPQSLYGASPVLAPRHPLADMPTENTTQQGGVPGPWIERLPHFRLEFTPSNGDELQSEYLVPRRYAAEALVAVRSLADRIAPHLHVTELRTMAADSLWLSGAFETDALGIHFTWKKQPEHVLPLLPVIEEALAPFDARPHWGKLFHDVRRELYPRLSDFVDLAGRMDPSAKFRNEFLDRFLF